SPVHSKILILDFGSQYTQVIARRIRELQVYSEVVRFDISAPEIKQLQPNGIILSGGPASVYDKGAPQIDKEIFWLGIPVLGICYGLMQMAHHLGGEVVFTGKREYGAGTLQISDGSQLFHGLGNQLDVWNSHGDEVTALPKGFLTAGRTESSNFAAVEDRERKLYGLQFRQLRTIACARGGNRATRFRRKFSRLFKICGCKRTLSRITQRRDGSRNQAQAHRQRVHKSISRGH